MLFSHESNSVLSHFHREQFVGVMKGNGADLLPQIIPSASDGEELFTHPSSRLINLHKLPTTLNLHDKITGLMYCRTSDGRRLTQSFIINH